MTRKYVLYVVSVVILVSLGFGIVFSVENQTGAIYENEEEESDFCLEMDSDVRSEDCFLCGKRNNSLMPYYSKRDSIGIIHWNHQSICDTEVRAYDDDGNEILGQMSIPADFEPPIRSHDTAVPAYAIPAFQKSDTAIPVIDTVEHGDPLYCIYALYSVNTDEGGHHYDQVP